MAQQWACDLGLMNGCWEGKVFFPFYCYAIKVLVWGWWYHLAPHMGENRQDREWPDDIIWTPGSGYAHILLSDLTICVSFNIPCSLKIDLVDFCHLKIKRCLLNQTVIVFRRTGEIFELLEHWRAFTILNWIYLISFLLIYNIKRTM